eukprot:Colp12_sorted_trinity150504_noHs@21655
MADQKGDQKGALKPRGSASRSFFEKLTSKTSHGSTSSVATDKTEDDSLRGSFSDSAREGLVDEDGEEAVVDADAPADSKSVIMHLIKQLSIGMDLTKVTLPTWILEKSSLLEKFADFMGNPLAFSQLSDPQTPQERFMGVLHWYLTSFHTFKQGPIAKKPYNPILGEIFECWWDGEENGGRTTYFAEQVSHHPPVTAFYFENKEKRICLNAHVWTQSKFLGTSVASVLVGQAVVYLLDHNEEYVLTYPTAYGRSIFTVPKMEFGGKTVVECKHTGYSAEVEFKTKALFGREMNGVHCEVREKGNKKLGVIQGKWNETMTFVKPDKTSSEYFNIATAPHAEKQCRPLDQQLPHESRRMWADVTDALARHDIKAATEAKERLENRQRKEAAERKEKNETYVPKHFTWNEATKCWEYNDMLTKRQ